MIFLVNKGNFSHCIQGNFLISFEGKNKIQGDVVKLNKFMLLNILDSWNPAWVFPLELNLKDKHAQAHECT